MTLMFQKIPVSLCCYFTSLRSNPYGQAPEGGGDEEQHQVIAIVKTATFVVAVLGSIRTNAVRPRASDPLGFKMEIKTTIKLNQPKELTANGLTTVQFKPWKNHVPDAGP